MKNTWYNRILYMLLIMAAVTVLWVVPVFLDLVMLPYRYVVKGMEPFNLTEKYYEMLERLNPTG